jgi:hypothetical protein
MDWIERKECLHQSVFRESLARMTEDSSEIAHREMLSKVEYHPCERLN